MRPLGKNQKEVLRCLETYGAYHPVLFCGWCYSTESQTKKICDSLVKRGLVEINSEGWYMRKKDE